MKQTYAFFFLACVLLTSCGSPPPKTKPEQFTIQYTAATIPWLTKLYNCADGNLITAEQREADFLDLTSVNMVIRIGRPDSLNGFAYQIGTDDLLVIANLKNPTGQLSTDQVYGLFSGQIENWKIINRIDAPVRVWVYPDGEDIEGIIKQTVLHGSPVASAANLANNPTEMQESVQKDENAIGIITQRWKNGNVASVYTAANNLPVLAITPSRPQGTLSQILGCMQK
jgi:PBP superfamily domain